MSYRVLVLPQYGVMSTAVLKRIHDLVADGGIVAGVRPSRTPGLADYPRSDADLKAMASAMWGDLDGTRNKERSLGKGKIYSVTSLGEVFSQENIPTDFSYRSKTSGAELGYIHRRDALADAYFIANRKNRNETAECTFRLSGRRPMLLDPVTGKSWLAASFQQSHGMTTVPLDFAPYGSLFVIFREPLAADVQGNGSTNFPKYAPAAGLDGPWEVRFDPKWGGPETTTFDKLQSWTTRPEEGIKYYSGTATYRKNFDLPPAVKGAHGIALNLGEVKYVAQVRLNGKDLGPVWTKPYRVDITDAVKPSGNVLEIDIANLWPNRIIGDSVLPPERRFTHTNIVYTQDTPLWESGLLGPVKLELIEDQNK